HRRAARPDRAAASAPPRHRPQPHGHGRPLGGGERRGLAGAGGHAGQCGGQRALCFPRHGDRGTVSLPQTAGGRSLTDTSAPAAAPRVTALDLPPLDPLPERTQKYFDICVEKLGMIPNVLLAYAFDIAKLDAFTGMYNDLMLGP